MHHFFKIRHTLPPILADVRRRSLSNFNSLIDVHPTVQNALSHGQPTVALESTIITHGMPYPSNVDTALAVEEIVRAEGALPVTIAILGGRIKVGLSVDQIKHLASLGPDGVLKCSRRDLAYVVSNQLNGGTTVAGTMIIANLCGIKVFATGGIGGVHRQGHETFDVSADLIELGRTPVAVVSSGVKSILDIPRTLEYLETQGVFISTYKSPDCDFPAFYTPKSGFRVPYNLNSAVEAADVIRTSFDLKLNSGMLIGVPIPKDESVDKNLIDEAISDALKDAEKNHIAGKEVTPFLLSAIANITRGQSLTANIALIKNNAKVAARISRELYRPEASSISRNSIVRRAPTPVVVGGSILDVSLQLSDDIQLNGSTYPVKTKTTGGGVGRNIADSLTKLYGRVEFISAVGSDETGKTLLNSLPRESVNSIFVDKCKSTSICSVILDKEGDCKLILGNMEIHKSITPALITDHEKLLSEAPLIIMDGNLTVESMLKILEIAEKQNRPVFYEPTDMNIAGKPFELPKVLTKQIKFISPNIHELHTISRTLNGKDIRLNKTAESDPVNYAKELLASVRDHFDCILLTMGESGVILDRKISSERFFDKNACYLEIDKDHKKRSTRFYPARKVNRLVNVSGAGDSFSSGFISGMLQGRTEAECVAFGFYAANKALQSESAVPDTYFESDEERANVLKGVETSWRDI